MADISAFDPTSFLTQETTEAACRRPPLPVNDYSAMIEEIKPRIWNKWDDPSKSGLVFDIVLSVQVPAEAQAALGGLTSIKLTDGIFADVTDQGNLDWSVGKNSGLRKYREATGLNTPGQPFSPAKLQGQPVKVKVGQRVMPDGELTEDIKGITKP